VAQLSKQVEKRCEIAVDVSHCDCCHEVPVVFDR
jgi:hypothetical protein